MRQKVTYALVGVVLGIVFGNQIRQLPLVSKIPQV